MCKTIVIANQKGGVAKTTTTQVFGIGLTNKGYKVLLIDLDPQGNLTSLSDLENSEKNIYKAIKNDIELNKGIIKSEFGYDIIAGANEIAKINMEFANTENREYLLKNILKEVKVNYDYIIIDTPPSLGLISINGLVAADEVLIPMTADKLALEGFGKLYQTIYTVKKFSNRNLKIKGIILNMYQDLKLEREYKKALFEIATQIKVKVFNTNIRTSTIVKRRQSENKNILFLKSEKVVNDFENLINEYLEM